ncbi:Predicted dehydrogenase [Caldanaerobius fijiensis DSM 17918]|uniref:Predicted dehydrogenase n=1 Tax=Caldanaerobius fijiensis DSM 17918 TaxID=1121256 RepID=A0A1M5B5H9_9THEO|nr:Gfo/Idh/MocA family oxidoreductase [Caldanaerobius fijiensis]SHF37452.1 Predicted dehydrogenase [Caldanaerobius fijiensis DSM 17918]
MRMARIGLVGINGFGRTHLNTIEKLERKYIEFKAFSEINYEKNKSEIEKLKSKGAHYYMDYREMLNSEEDLDFVVLSTPIHLHSPMAIQAMEKGFNVLLEKPPSVTIQDVDRIIEVSKKTGKVCAVDFQNTSGKAFRKLLDYVAEGRFGSLKSLVGIGRWERDESYYRRTPWAGKLMFDGNYVLDGTINNPLSHLLNNLLILAGVSCHNGGVPAEVTAELYHGHKIESEDTACVRIITEAGIEILSYTTLCSPQGETPFIVLEGTKGSAYWAYNNELKIKFCDGSDENFDFGPEDLFENMYINMIKSLFQNNKLYCPVELTRNFVLASNGAFESSDSIKEIPDDYLIINKEGESVVTYIKDISDIIDRASSEKKLFSEVGVPWALKSMPFKLNGYKEFKKYKREGGNLG